MFGLGLRLVEFALAKLALELMGSYSEVNEACRAYRLSICAAEAYSTTASLLSDKATREKSLKALEGLQQPE